MCILTKDLEEYKFTMNPEEALESEFHFWPYVYSLDWVILFNECFCCVVVSDSFASPPGSSVRTCDLTLTWVSACSAAKSCPTLLRPHGLQPSRLLWPWDFPDKNTGAGCHLLLQAIFLTQRSNTHLLHWQAESIPLSYLESPSDCWILD